MNAARVHWTAAELLAHDFPPVKWAVPGVIAEGLTLLAGAPKVGKSWAALGIAVACAAGGKALRRVDVDPGPVLYLALEDTPRRLADRLRKVLDGAPVPEPLSFVTACPPITSGGLDRIGEWLDQHPDARLVIVDVFARIRGRAVDTAAPAYDVDYAAMSALKALADRHGVAVLVVHHTRKATAEDFLDAVSGTNGLAGAADAILVLRRSRGSADAELHVTGRDIDETVYALTFDAAIGTWRMLDGEASDYTLSDTRQTILRYLRDVQSATPKQISEALGIDHAAAKQTCWRMSKDGQLDTDGHGLYLPLSPVTPVTAVTPPGDTGDTGDSHHEVTALCGHPVKVISTANGRCALCIAEGMRTA